MVIPGLTKEQQQQAKEFVLMKHKTNGNNPFSIRLAEIYSLKEEEILKNPKLYELIETELDKKIEGEYEARKAIFLTFNMRNVANLNKATDNLMINDEGGTGKDYVVSAVYNILPNEEKVKRERITPKVLAYLNDIKSNPKGWEKKALYLEDVPNAVLNDDSFKVMSSADPNGITQTSIIINNKIMDIDIKGKPSILLTIATASPKQELLRRYPICNLTSSVKQTKAILKKQAIFAERGITENYDPSIKKALGHLKRVKVKVPYANLISDAFPAGNVIIRTHFPRFLDYIKSSCALYQYQRERDKDGYYLATAEDYENAREIMAVTTSNQLMIPLTKKQKQILEKMDELPKLTFSFQELEQELQSIAQDRWLRKLLDRLVEQGFLRRGNEKREHSIKPLAVYSYNSLVKLVLPSFKELNYCSNKTLSTNNTNNTNSSYWGVKASSHNLTNLNYLSCEFKEEVLEKWKI